LAEECAANFVSYVQIPVSNAVVLGTILYEDQFVTYLGCDPRIQRPTAIAVILLYGRSNVLKVRRAAEKPVP